MGAHAEQQRFVRLTGAVDANVGDRGGRQHPAHRVARLRLDRLLVDEVGVVGLLRVLLARPIHHPGQQRVVCVEQPVEVGDVPHAERRLAHLRRARVPVAAVDARVVGDVPRRLLEVRHQPAPLEDLRQQVRRLLAREVHAAELRDRVVAVLEEHALVELLGAPEADGRVDREVAGEVEISDEFVEEQTPEALVGA